MQSKDAPKLSDYLVKWKESLGDDVANALAEYVEKAMEDYNYLYQFRLLGESA